MNMSTSAGDALPQWKAAPLISGVAAETIIHITFDGKGGAEAVRRWDIGKRVRDIEVRPDGSLWTLENGAPGDLYHLMPKEIGNSGSLSN
jgi:glucose/arabinose dehydrogenase